MAPPAWNEMSYQQKCDFLHQWCENLSAAIQELRGHTQGLHERLRTVEAKLEESERRTKP